VKLALPGALVLAACAGTPARPTVVDTSPPPEASSSEPPSPTPPVAPARSERLLPRGEAALAIHVERGKRQPLMLVGSVAAILPPAGKAGLDAWWEIRLAGSPPGSFRLDVKPTGVALPFEEGDRIALEIDCRKGGWERVCDGVVRDMQRTPLLIVSGSGSDEVATGWRIERGAVATTEVHPGPPRTVRYTHSLSFERLGATVTALPHEWSRLTVHGRSWLVTGYEEAWDGPRPPDARNHRTFAIVLEK